MHETRCANGVGVGWRGPQWRGPHSVRGLGFGRMRGSRAPPPSPPPCPQAPRTSSPLPPRLTTCASRAPNEHTRMTSTMVRNEASKGPPPQMTREGIVGGGWGVGCGVGGWSAGGAGGLGITTPGGERVMIFCLSTPLFPRPPPPPRPSAPAHSCEQLGARVVPSLHGPMRWRGEGGGAASARRRRRALRCARLPPSPAVCPRAVGPRGKRRAVPRGMGQARSGAGGGGGTCPFFFFRRLLTLARGGAVEALPPQPRRRHRPPRLPASQRPPRRNHLDPRLRLDAQSGPHDGVKTPEVRGQAAAGPPHCMRGLRDAAAPRAPPSGCVPRPGRHLRPVLVAGAGGGVSGWPRACGCGGGRCVRGAEGPPPASAPRRRPSAASCHSQTTVWCRGG